VGEVRSQYGRTIDAFKRAGAEGALHIVDRKPDEPIAHVLWRQW
jgi:hypothetical protein